MKIRGLTLLELVITLAIFTGLVLIGSKSFIFLTQKNERQILINNIKTAVQYSKIQAIIIGKSVYLTPLNLTENWSKGMMLVSFNEITKKMDVIHQWQWNLRYWNVNWIGVDSVNRIGLSQSPSHAISNGKFILDNWHTHEKVMITLNRLGRVKIG